MYFSKVIAIAVLTFAASAVAAPASSNSFEITSPVEVREAEAGGTSWDVEAREADVEADTSWGVAEEEDDEVFEAREAKPHLEARGFGCGTFSHDRYQCSDHCKSLNGGRTGGYCGGFLWHTCICVFG